MAYAYQGPEEHTAKAMGKRLRISTKQSIMVCKAIRGKSVEEARDVLERAINKEQPIKFTRFKEGAGHKKGHGAGKYPVKTCTEILKVLNSAEANAQHQGLGADLDVVHAIANEAQRNLKYGRQARRKQKGTHVEIVVKEQPGSAPRDDESEEQSNADKIVDELSDDETDEDTPEREDTADTEPTDEETDDVPDDSWTVPEIKEWLDDNDIKYTSNDLKADLLDKVNQ
jgi:large subunit ribosomal protein L22